MANVPIPQWTLSADTAGGPSIPVKAGDDYGRADGVYAFTLYYYGTFGSGTVALQASPDGGTTWVTIPSSTASSATVQNLEIRATHLRPTLSGSTSPSLKILLL